MDAIVLEMYFLSKAMTLEGQLFSLTHKLQNGCCISRHKNIYLIVHLHHGFWIKCIDTEQTEI